MKTFILIIAAVCVCVHGQTPRYSSKTGYETSFEPGTDEKAQRYRDWPTIASDVGEANVIDQCEPAGVYAVHRHGVRYASDGDIEDYNAILTRMKTYGVNDQFSAFLNIPDNLYPIALEGQLHPAGFAEMQGLGSRMKGRLPELFGGNTAAGVTFQGTYRQRTRDSAQGFIEGLLGEVALCDVTNTTSTQDNLTCTVNADGDVETVVIDHEVEGNDILLKFYESCTKYIMSVDDNDTAVIEATKFSDGPELTAVYDAVAAKLAVTGTAEPWNMSKEELEVMHHMCGYETAYYGNSSWCDIFTDAESLVVEYLLDLDQYWAESYGHPINYEMACPLVDDIVTYLESVKMGGADTPKGKMKFGHSSTIQPLLAILGLYRDAPMLLSNNYDVSVNRTWRSGRIAPMSGHLSFNTFRCTGNSHRVLVLHDELPIKIGYCRDFFCDYDEVVMHLRTSSDSCQWDELCGTKGVYPGLPNAGYALSTTLSWAVTMLTSILIFLFNTN